MPSPINPGDGWHRVERVDKPGHACYVKIDGDKLEAFRRTYTWISPPGGFVDDDDSTNAFQFYGDGTGVSSYKGVAVDTTHAPSSGP